MATRKWVAEDQDRLKHIIKETDGKCKFYELEEQFGFAAVTLYRKALPIARIMGVKLDHTTVRREGEPKPKRYPRKKPIGYSGKKAEDSQHLRYHSKVDDAPAQVNNKYTTPQGLTRYTCQCVIPEVGEVFLVTASTTKKMASSRIKMLYPVVTKVIEVFTEQEHREQNRPKLNKGGRRLGM